MKRYMSIWFRHLMTDRLAIRQPELRGQAFVLAAPARGRMVIQSASTEAVQQGIVPGMVLADARALLPAVQVFDDEPLMVEKRLRHLAEWCLRYTPVAAIDLPDGLILDITGCTHLWGGEQAYLKDLVSRLRNGGYDMRAAIADTIGTAWANARYGQITPIIAPGEQAAALSPLPPAALRLESAITERLHKLGLNHVHSFMRMPRHVLRRRFGQQILDRLDQALGQALEPIEPVVPLIPYQERLPCLEPIRTATGIEIALQKLLETLCQRLYNEGKGLRKGILKCYRVDGQLQQIDIGTNRAVRNTNHLFKLFELKISGITPALGIELFVLEAPVVDDLSVQQETLWGDAYGYESTAISNLLDRLAGRIGQEAIHRYLPDEHHWPERSLRLSASYQEQPAIDWPQGQVRPVSLLPIPEPIEVTVPIPDYPPLLFRYKGQVHKIMKADGPERIEREWWIEQGLQRDYYRVEDEQGARYWLFRSGHYHEHTPEWFLHGFFA